MPSTGRDRGKTSNRGSVAAAADTVDTPVGIPTMADIGSAAGVTPSTVSRVLNNAQTSFPIAPATRERVLAAARELEYRPNPHARRLRGAPTMLLGVIVRDFSDPFFAAVIEALAT